MSRRAEPTPPAAPGWRNRIVGEAELPPRELLVNPRNWRRHSDDQRRALRGVLGGVGWVQRLIVNRETGHLIDGHARLDEALARGEDTVPVLYVSLTPEEEALVLATLDPIGAMAEAEGTALADLLSAIETADEDLQALLAQIGDANGIRPEVHGDPDEAPELPDPADVYVGRGDLWALGTHRLVCGDALDADDVARLLGGAKPTLLTTDPPYGVSLDNAWRDAIPRTDGRRSRSSGRTEGHRNTTMVGDQRADWAAAYELVPSLAVGYVWHAGVHARAVAQGLERIGFDVVSQLIWQKLRFALGRSWYHWQHEPCFVVRRPGVNVPFLGPRDQSTVWEAASPKVSGTGHIDEPVDHPTQKPVLLFERPIRNHLRAGEAVYDPFLGSGTALVAAEASGRRCLGMDIDPRFVQLSIERWQRFTGRQAERLESGPR